MISVRCLSTPNHLPIAFKGLIQTLNEMIEITDAVLPVEH